MKSYWICFDGRGEYVYEDHATARCALETVVAQYIRQQWAAVVHSTDHVTVHRRNETVEVTIEEK